MKDTRLSGWRHRRVKKKPLWEFVNSNFGLWLLSALFLTGVGSGYTAWRDQVQAREARQAATSRITSEMQYRVLQARKLLDDVYLDHRALTFYEQLRDDVENDCVPYESHSGEPPSGTLKQRVLEAITKKVEELAASPRPSPVDLLFDPPADRYPPLYSEFQNLSLPALLALYRDQLRGSHADMMDQEIRHIARIRSTGNIHEAALRLFDQTPNYIRLPKYSYESGGSAARYNRNTVAYVKLVPASRGALYVGHIHDQW